MFDLNFGDVKVVLGLEVTMGKRGRPKKGS